MKSFNEKLKAEITHKKYNIEDLVEQNKKKICDTYYLCGYISNPAKDNHLEFDLKNVDEANKLVQLLLSFDIESKIAFRGKSFIVYIKDIDNIIKLLNIIGASKTLTDYNNIINKKKINSLVQRQINFDEANIKRITSASIKQLDDINFILKSIREENIEKKLLIVMKERTKHPDASYSELCQYIGNISKSTLNNRFKSINLLAKKLGK